jgi:hypothetical protein
LDTLEFLDRSLGGLSRVIGKVDGLETTLLETTKSLEHTLKAKYLLGHLLNVHLKLLDVFFDIDDGHIVLI